MILHHSASSGPLGPIGTSLIIPVLGFVVAAPLAAGLDGAGAAAIAGGLVGALISGGIPKNI